ncbi:MAG: DUF1810 domain-containing protein [Novosphingobium sp.]|nr:DUF1810 domain-containing protein [Novosphingobium sp.]
MEYNLDRFIEAQTSIYSQALSEITRGRKTSHWMWFIFPQLAGLGRSAIAQRYGIGSLNEARAYLAHPTLGNRYIECVEALQDLPLSDPKAVLGAIDATKLLSSLTLFTEAAPEQKLFTAALERWFRGIKDQQTLDLLKTM